jgi:hypothetical protein
MENLDLRPLLEEKLAEAERVLKRAVSGFLEAKDRAVTARQDVEAYRQALEAVSRNNGHPYVAQPLATAIDDMLGVSNGHKPTAKARRHSSSPLTKSAIVRDAIRDNPGLRSREVWEKIQGKNLPVAITMDDMHRTLGRLTMREEIRRDSLGGLYVTEKASKE